jgi:hypothetical protein
MERGISQERGMPQYFSVKLSSNILFIFRFQALNKKNNSSCRLN